MAKKEDNWIEVMHCDVPNSRDGATNGELIINREVIEALLKQYVMPQYHHVKYECVRLKPNKFGKPFTDEKGRVVTEKIDEGVISFRVCIDKSSIVPMFEPLKKE